MACRKIVCPDCGDELIHQSKRRGGESSSALGQHVFDTLGKDFYFCDIDGVVYKVAHQLMRIIEHKPVGKELKGSQLHILPLLAEGVSHLISSGSLHERSGVFVVNSDPPFRNAVV